jgi:uncharacterized protein YdeI (YjbR/CyaY-like superfamily)
VIERPELYFPRDIEWREWLEVHYASYPKGVDLIFYKLESKIPSMRWEEAVRVALCFGWIDSTVKNIGGPKRRQFFCPRNPKSTWSALNKKYVLELDSQDLIHESGWKLIQIAKETGTWTEMDHVENLIIPADLQRIFDLSPLALENYQKFSPGYRKSYLAWLHNAKREETRQKRITIIIENCVINKKMRD